MNRQVTQDINEYYAKMGLVYRTELAAVIALAATGVYYVGFTTGPTAVRVLSRSYSSSESPLTIELFETTFTGGVALRTLNANLNVANSINPAPQFGAVTPGALVTPVTGIVLRAPTVGGTAALSITSDASPLVLKPNTSYVLRFTNGGGANANIGAVTNLRFVQPEE